MPASIPSRTAVPTERVDFLLFPGFAMLAFASALDALRHANYFSSKPLYRWRTRSADGAAVASAGGVTVQVDAAIDTDRAYPDLCLVVASNATETAAHRAAYAYLRRIARSGNAVGGVSLGSYVLARAGLLDGHRCTVHWENLEAFREAFPRLEATGEIFEYDRRRLTCAGGTAALDLLLAHIAARHGAPLARRVADICMVERIRAGHEPQRLPLRARLGVAHPRLLEAVALIESSTDRRYGHTELAGAVGVSPRHLERLFRKYLGTTPRAYQLRHRLRRARRLLRETTLDVLEVATACGFATASHFTKSYREHYGVTPSADRG